MTAKINFNGREYAIADEMPADVRQLYEQMMGAFDANRNGVPDILEGGGSPVNVQVTGSINVMHEGKVYTRVEDMPPDLRQKYEKAMSLLGDADQNGVPDILESAGLFPPQPSQPPALTSTPPLITSGPPVISDATPSYTKWLAIGAVVVILLGLLAVAAVVGVFVLRSFLR